MTGVERPPLKWGNDCVEGTANGVLIGMHDPFASDIQNNSLVYTDWRRFYVRRVPVSPNTNVPGSCQCLITTI